MKTLFLALALVASTLASAACPPGIPKIIGLDYHTARAKLINAGFLPVIPKGIIDPDSFDSYPLRFGYLEGEGGTTGNAWAGFQWHGFTVLAMPCEYGVPHECTVRRITCP